MHGVDAEGSPVVGAGVKRFGCSPAAEPFLHRAFDPCAVVRQTLNEGVAQPLDGQSLRSRMAMTIPVRFVGVCPPTNRRAG